jgi:hypothetical protein
VRTRLGVVGLVLLGLAGCGGTPPRQPVPSSTPSVSGVAPTTHGPAPAVSRRLDLSGHLANPCELLAKDDLTALGFRGSYVVIPPNQGATDHLCVVGAGEGSGELQLTLRTDASPLSEAYASAPDRYKYFQPTEISGFPAVALATSVEFPVACYVRVGTDEGQGVTLEQGVWDISQTSQQACGRLVVAAQAVMRRLGA